MMTPNSVWQPSAERLASLPYGGSLEEAVRNNDRGALRRIQAEWGMEVLESDEVIDMTLALARQPSSSSRTVGQGCSTNERTPLNAASFGSPGPSNTPTPGSNDPLTAWCIRHHFTNIEHLLRANGVSDLADLKYVDEDMLKGMGIEDSDLRSTFFLEANTFLSPPIPTPTPPQPRAPSPPMAWDAEQSDTQVLDSVLARSLFAEVAVRRSDSDLARELYDADLARMQQYEEDQLAVLRFDCPVCRDSQPGDGSFTGTCGHRICGSCIFEYVAGKLDGDQTSEEQLKCVICSQPLTPEEVVGVLQPYDAQDLIDKFLNQRLTDSTRNGPFRACPNCDAIHFLTDEEAAAPGECSTCRLCESAFCSRCSQPYHYFNQTQRDELQCAELMRQKQAEWLAWRAEGMAEHIEKLAQVDKEYAEQLQVYSDGQAHRAAYDAFLTDERSKRGWVHCPHCRVVWEGSDACPEVTCGVLEQAMGSKRGPLGCGQRFNLRNGIPYEPITLPPPPEEASRPQRPVAVEHRYVACDKCGMDPILGVRIRCLRCPVYNLCLPCLARDGPEHLAEAEGDAHVFEVLHEPLPLP